LRSQLTKRKADILSYLSNEDSKKRFFPPPITRVPRTSRLPLSFAQERLWFLDQLEPGNTAYNICRAAQLRGTLDSDVLEASLNEIIRRHEVLRTSFEINDGQPVQVVAPDAMLKLSISDLSKIAEVDRDHEIEHFVTEEARRPFDLTQAPLLRAKLLRLGDADHVFILATHHIVSDAWSMGILTREMWSLYEACANDRPQPLQALGIQYADFAVWQRSWLQGEVLESQLAYWKKQLDDFSILNLPSDRPRPPRQSFYGARQSITVPQRLTAAINELSHGEGVTPFMTLLAAFQVLLYRYSGQEDVIVGSPIANRGATEFESLIGFFVNTLVLRADLSGNPTFKEALARGRETCLSTYAHQDLPFEKLVEELKPERDTSRNPIFQVMFGLQNATRPFSGIPSLRIEPIEILPERSIFDLSLFLREREGSYIGYIEYSTDLFDASTIDRMTGHFHTLLEGIVADPERRISELPILTDAERHQLLVEWDDTAADYPEDKCIHELFEEQVEKTPDAIAVTHDGRELTYRDLNTRANQVAHYLRGLGIGPEKLVGTCVERSLEMVVALLGILKAGGAYLPIDPAYPAERLDFIISDAQCSVLLTHKKCLESGRWSVIGHQPSYACIDRDWEAMERESTQKPETNVNSNNLAYVIYTSGSTGKPKGVLIEHRNTVSLLHWARSLFSSEELSGVLACTPICFDLSVFELFVPLAFGGTVILVENVLHLPNLRERGKITLINTVPSAMTELLRINGLPETIRTVNLAGEPLRSDLVRQLYSYGAVNKVYDLYGPSETTTYSTFTLRRANRRATIGRPIAHTQIYILNGDLHPVPVGITGEIVIGGAGVARGYLNRPELTAEKFIPNPFREGRDDRLYRTGDIGCYLPDGNIEFLGRLDNQVKIRGYRIELGEIEAVMNQHPAVEQSVIVAHDRESSQESQLVAYFVPKQGATPSVSELCSFLQKTLPKYMIPSVFIPMTKLAITPNGKIDRKALPAANSERPLLNQGFVKPQTEIHELVAQIWRDVLKLDKIGIHDNFFELGGHSLLAIQIISRVREAFDKDVPLSAIFEAPTVGGLAATIGKTISNNASDLPPVMPLLRNVPLPLSPNQEHLWQLDKLFPGNHFFNMPYVYQIDGNLNLAALERSIEEIINRHEALRTFFAEIDGRPVQMVRPPARFHLPIVDMRNRDATEISDSAAEIIFDARQQPFDLALDPLVRIKLLRLTDKKYFLLITMHHLVYDEWSMRVFRHELSVLYEAFLAGRAVPLVPSIQYSDFATWEAQLVGNGLLDKQLDYWRNRLAGRPPQLQFKRTRKRQRALSFQTKRKRLDFGKNLSAAIKTLASKERVTPFIIVVSILNVLLHIWTGEQDIRIGALVGNRAQKEKEGIIGPFINTLVLRTAIDPTMTLRRLVERVRTIVYSALANQELPFEHLARVLEKEGIRRASLFQVLLNYHEASFDSTNLSGITFAPLRWPQLDSMSEMVLTACDIVFDVRATPTLFTGHVNYKAHTVGNHVVTDIVSGFARILERMRVNTETTVSSIA
jgi:amino acid adenylation domain-containing protein